MDLPLGRFSIWPKPGVDRITNLLVLYDIHRIKNKFANKTGKEAIVVSETRSFGLPRMCDGVVYSENYELSVFNDIHETRR